MDRQRDQAGGVPAVFAPRSNPAVLLTDAAQTQERESQDESLGDSFRGEDPRSVRDCARRTESKSKEHHSHVELS